MQARTLCPGVEQQLGCASFPLTVRVARQSSLCGSIKEADCQK